MNQKLLALCAAGVLAIAMAGCSDTSGTASSEPTETIAATEVPVEMPTEEPTDAPADAAGVLAGTADLSKAETVEGLTYHVDPAWTAQDTSSEVPSSDGMGNLTVILRTYIAGDPADMNMMQVQAQQLDPSLVAMIDALDDDALATALGSMGTVTSTTSTEYGDVTTSMENMEHPPAGACAAWVYTAEYAEGVPMRGAEIVTDTHLYVINAVGTVADLWPQIEASLSLAVANSEEVTDTVDTTVATGVAPTVYDDANVSGFETFTAVNGELESVHISKLDAGNTMVVKYVFDVPDKSAVEENIVDLIQNQGASAFDEIQMWAVDGSGTKFMAFTLDQPDIMSVADGSVPAGALRSVAKAWESY